MGGVGGGKRDLWGRGWIWRWMIGLRVEGDGQIGNGRRRKPKKGKGGLGSGVKEQNGEVRGGVYGVGD
ncbi:unnamed protein product [Prunus armeniaca]